MNRRSGFSLIELLVVIAILALLVALIASAIHRVRGAAARVECANRMRQVALALQQYHDANGVFPEGCSVQDGNSKTLYAGWHVQILPHIERENEYRIAMDDFRRQPWSTRDSTHSVFTLTIPTYVCPQDSRIANSRAVMGFQNPVAFTSYLGVCGTDCMVPSPDGILFTDSRIKRTMISDGLSQTVMIGERPPSENLRRGWWYAGIGQQDSGSTDMILGVRERNFDEVYPCTVRDHHYKSGTISEPCDIYHFWSLHPSGAHFAYADGSATMIAYEARNLLEAQATRAGNESIGE
jgi:prepilin-type N-terminal cleavage/methylation domain-containing protein/prepilin-type processing-associated H-X9-DG protein